MLPSRLFLRYENGEWGDYITLYTYSIKKKCFFKRSKIDLISWQISNLPKTTNITFIKAFLYHEFVIKRCDTLIERKLKKLK